MAAFSIIAGPSNGRMLYAGLSISAGLSEQSPFPSQKFKASLQLPPCLSPEAGRADTTLLLLLLLLLWFLRCLLSFLALAMLPLLLHQLHFLLLLQLLCFFLSLFSFFRFRSSSIFRLFFFNSSAPSDPYSRSAAPDTTAAAASSNSINQQPQKTDLRQKKTFPKLLHFQPPLVLVLCSPSTPLLLPMLIILFQLPPTADAATASSTPIKQQPQKTDLQPPQNQKPLPKQLYFPPLLLQPLCFFRHLLFSFTCSRCSPLLLQLHQLHQSSNFTNGFCCKRILQESCEELPLVRKIPTREATAV
jgi:hypothetical protein